MKMKITQDRKQVRIREAARMLGVCRRTVQRAIAAGHLDSHFLPGAPINGARYIPVDQVVAMAQGKRNRRVLDAITGKMRDSGWDERNRVLQLKAAKLAEARGPQVVLDILAGMGVANISDLDDEQQRLFNSRLSRACGYDGKSRTTAWRRRKEAQAARPPEPWELVTQESA